MKNGKILTDKIEKKNGFYVVNDNQIVFILETISKEIIDEVLKLKPQKAMVLNKLFN